MLPKEWKIEKRAERVTKPWERDFPEVKQATGTLRAKLDVL
jgi:hypothetical protein